MSVRETNKQRTRHALANAAVDLFTQRGYDAVTMADVAESAGVSRRTAFRYFASKDDLLMEYPLSWLPLFDEAVERHGDLPLPDRLRAASHAIAAHIEVDPEPVKRAMAIALSQPALAARYAAVARQWIDRIATEIAGEPPESPEEAVRTRVLASAVMGMIDTTLELWAAGDEPMSPLLDVGFDLLDGAFTQARQSKVELR